MLTDNKDSQQAQAISKIKSYIEQKIYDETNIEKKLALADILVYIDDNYETLI